MSAEIGNRKSEVRWNKLLELVKAGTEPIHGHRATEFWQTLPEDVQNRYAGIASLIWLRALSGSVDAAMELIERELPGWRRQLFERENNTQWIARVVSPTSLCISIDDDPRPLPAFALLAVLLEAHIYELRD